MKSVLASLTLFTLFAILAPSTSHALVVSEADCTSSDGSLEVSIVDNQGTGFDRSSHLLAIIEDPQGNLIASVPVQVYVGVSSASFGRPTYIDIATQGATLTVQGPSTNVRNFLIHYATPARSIIDENLNCARFMGQTY